LRRRQACNLNPTRRLVRRESRLTDLAAYAPSMPADVQASFGDVVALTAVGVIL
jgi:hypothetical protein